MQAAQALQEILKHNPKKARPTKRKVVSASADGPKGDPDKEKGSAEQHAKQHVAGHVAVKKEVWEIDSVSESDCELCEPKTAAEPMDKAGPFLNHAWTRTMKKVASSWDQKGTGESMGVVAGPSSAQGVSVHMQCVVARGIFGMCFPIRLSWHR